MTSSMFPVTPCVPVVPGSEVAVRWTVLKLKDKTMWTIPQLIKLCDLTDGVYHKPNHPKVVIRGEYYPTRLGVIVGKAVTADNLTASSNSYDLPFDASPENKFVPPAMA